jgi:hypothetical protein
VTRARSIFSAGEFCGVKCSLSAFEQLALLGGGEQVGSVPHFKESLSLPVKGFVTAACQLLFHSSSTLRLRGGHLCSTCLWFFFFFSLTRNIFTFLQPA